MTVIHVAGNYWKAMPKWRKNVFYCDKTSWCVYKGLRGYWYCISGRAEKGTRPYGPYKTRDEAMSWTVRLQDIENMFGKGVLENPELQEGIPCRTKISTITLPKLTSLLES
jgi:hypothetical protein